MKTGACEWPADSRVGLAKLPHKPTPFGEYDAGGNGHLAYAGYAALWRFTLQVRLQHKKKRPCSREEVEPRPDGSQLRRDAKHFSNNSRIGTTFNNKAFDYC